MGADVVPDPDSGAGGTVLATNAALEVIGYDVEPFWRDSLPKRIEHGNLHNLTELPLTYLREVRRRLSARSFDIVQLSQPYSYLAARYVKALPETVFLWRSHGLEAKVDAALRRHSKDPPKGFRKYLQDTLRVHRDWVQKKAVEWSDGVVVPCEDDRDFLIEAFGADPQRVRKIWHGVPDDFIHTPVPTSPERWSRVLHVSQLSANKGPLLLKRVCADLLCQYPELTLTWVCPRESHDESRRGLSEFMSRVSLRDWVARGDLRGIFDSHGIFLFPAIAEGAAKVVMEAMSRGMCVVASRTSGPADYIESGKNGVLVDVGDSGAMIEATCELLRDSGRAEALGAAARETAADFSWGRCAHELADFHDELISRKKSVVAGNGKG